MLINVDRNYPDNILLITIKPGVEKLDQQGTSISHSKTTYIR